MLLLCWRRMNERMPQERYSDRSSKTEIQQKYVNEI